MKLILQHFLTRHGDHFLQIIKHMSQQLDISLDGEATLQTATAKKVSVGSTQPRKLTPAKFDAWKMWLEDGLSLQRIAVCVFFLYNFPFHIKYFLYFFRT